MTTQEQSANATKWLEALLSGKYKQNTNARLKIGDTYCCWGVGCELMNIHIQEGESAWNNDLGDKIGWSSGQHPDISPKVEGVNYLWSLNDGLKWPFERIAKWLIEHAETNFIPDVAQAIKTHFA